MSNHPSYVSAIPSAIGGSVHHADRRDSEIGGSLEWYARSVPRRLSSRTQCTASIPLLADGPHPARFHLNRVRRREIWRNPTGRHAASRLFPDRPLGGDAVAVSPGARELAALDDQIFISDRAAVEITFEDFARSSGIARLR
jgi:hypothetical protein